ncbi:alpha/beta hydrolase-fold protein [Planctomicrobium sp. SH668]|uniref:alpha/beta hydrolase-fold protein n=1 Tax=Planctomicrobium sp. SH668 TaxID=3448126 RepID=UPI003F5B6246
MYSRRNFLLTLVLSVFCLAPNLSFGESPNSFFEIQISPEIHHQPFTGRVYIFTQLAGDRSVAEPRTGPNWFRPQPFLSLDVEDLPPGESIVISLENPKVQRFPKDFSFEKTPVQAVQGVVRANPNVRQIGEGAGNWYSNVVPVKRGRATQVVVSQVVAEPAFPESETVKLLQVPSRLLSQFHGREVSVRGSVRLPASYFTQPKRRFPVIFEIPGFGGNHMYGLNRGEHKELNDLGVEFIRVMLDPDCGYGHHVFANSANNGPVLDALVEEFIPALDAAYRTDARSAGRFLTGHSSGGWSSLWIQVNAPEHFAGTWSTAPDPVTFSDFQQIDLYQQRNNMFRAEDGTSRPLARMNGKPIVFYEAFSQMEDVLGHGGQLQSFEAVFGPRGADGHPVPLWNRETGGIDPVVMQHWEQYDIVRLLVSNRESLMPKLEGKLHVYMGTEDTFYLEGATALLKDVLAELKSDAEIELMTGRDHFNLFEGGLKQRIEQEMAAKYLSTPIKNLQNAPGSTNVQ